MSRRTRSLMWPLQAGLWALTSLLLAVELHRWVVIACAVIVIVGALIEVVSRWTDRAEADQ